ncbi:hypothetical protein HYR99_27165 [Candidatus Poribacteria bacterium]|nr:hypothetical protein [Candidatus Poribacteria bacterium]
MFEKLYEVSRSQALGAAHYANRCIKHRWNIQKINPDEPPWTDTEPSIEEKRLAIELLQEIERVEQTPIHLLPPEKTDEYIGHIAGIVLKRSIEGMTPEQLQVTIIELRGHTDERST